MRGQPIPFRERAAGWVDGSDPAATRRLGWAAAGVLAVALAWPLASPNGSGPPTDDGVASAGAGAAAGRADPPRPQPTCGSEVVAPDPRPAGLATVSPSRVGTGGVVESTRWGAEGGRGLWGVAAVAECNAVRLDAVWIGPTGQKQRQRLSPPGESPIGVIANGLDGAISVYSVRADATGRLSALLHISTDWGRTWQERAVPASAEPDVRAGRLSPQWSRWPVAAG